jgi:outer membrane lipoprotein carrier protein
MTVVWIIEYRLRMACVLAGVLAGMALPTSAGGQDAAVAALHRAERMYERLSTLRADFVQTLENPMLGEEQATGRLFLAPPNRFAMRFTEPEGDRIVLDGEWLWLYAPSSVPDQVIRQPVPARGSTSPNLIGQFADRPLERYEAEFVRTETLGPGATVDVVKLRPRRDDMGFRWAEVAIAQDGMFHRIVVLEDSGQRRTLTFANLAVDVSIPETELRFTPQRGTRVVVP